MVKDVFIAFFCATSTPAVCWGMLNFSREDVLSLTTIRTFGAVSALALTAGVANAGSINFAVNSGSWQTGAQTYGAAGVYGGIVDGDGNITATDAYLRSWAGSSGGLGICSAANTSLCTYGSNESGGRDEHTIDGGGPNEIALLDFGSLNVEITSVTFAYWDSNDDFDYASYSSATVGQTPLVWKEDVDISGSGVRTYNFASGTLVGSVFGFGSDYSGDEFKLRGITYAEISAVPLPASSLLLLGAIGGLAAVRRKKA